MAYEYVIQTLREKIAKLEKEKKALKVYVQLLEKNINGLLSITKDLRRDLMKDRLTVDKKEAKMIYKTIDASWCDKSLSWEKGGEFDRLVKKLEGFLFDKPKRERGE